MSKHIKYALVLAGGKGTRLGSLALDIPKPLIEVQGKPVLLHLIEQLRKYGVETVFLSIGYLADKIKSYFDRHPVEGIKIVLVEESAENPLGTGGPLALLRGKVNEPFFILNGDTLTDVELDKFHAFHLKNKSTLTIALKEVGNTFSLGSVRMDGNRIVEFAEKPEKNSPSNIVNIGVYVANPEVMSLVEPGKPVSIEKDIFPALAKKKALYGFISKAQYFDIGTPERLENARKNWRP